MEVGQHVVCIHQYNVNDPNIAMFLGGGGTLPVKGTVYTVRSIRPRSGGENIGITLVEIVNKPMLISDGEVREVREVHFGASKFRPLQKLKVEDFLTIKAPKELS